MADDAERIIVITGTAFALGMLVVVVIWLLAIEIKRRKDRG